MALVLPDSILELLSSFSFKGNPKLRQRGAEVQYTAEMISEYRKCKADPIYFIKNYIYVVHPDRGVVKFDLYEYQERMIRAYHENKKVIFLTARQQGKTTVSAAYLLWYIIFNESKSVAILANKQATADEILQRMRMAYEELPKWLQAGVTEWNKRSIRLENGSSATAYASSSSSIRGKSISILYCDEFAFVPNTQAEEFFTAVYPTITAGKDTKVFMTSTPHGYNHFYKFWNEAEKGLNGFVPLRVHWYETPGRDQKWFDEQAAVLGELKAAQELLAEFLGSSRTLLTGATLARLAYNIPLKEYGEGVEKGLKIYAYPEKGKIYTMTVDTSRGRHLDYSAFIIYDITSYPHTIAATYRNNEISPMLYASLIHSMAKKYNDAYTLVEINDIGGQVADILWSELEYEELFWTKSGDMLGKKGADPYPGIRTTTKTKGIGCANLKDMIENNQLLINDSQIIQELSTFIQKENGKYAADEGFNDDLVMCLVLQAWMTTQAWFSDLTNTHLRTTMHDLHVKEMEDSLCMPFFDNGIEQEESVFGYWDFNT